MTATSVFGYTHCNSPVVGGGNLGAKQHRGAANCLLDDPAALRHAGDELQHAVPLLIGCRITQAALQEPVQQEQHDVF